MRAALAWSGRALDRRLSSRRARECVLREAAGVAGSRPTTMLLRDIANYALF